MKDHSVNEKLLFVFGKGMNLLKMGNICEDKHFLLAIGGELCWVKSLTNGLDIFFVFYVIILHGRRGAVLQNMVSRALVLN